MMETGRPEGWPESTGKKGFQTKQRQFQHFLAY